MLHMYINFNHYIFFFFFIYQCNILHVFPMHIRNNTQCNVHIYKTCILTIVGSSKNLLLVAWRYCQKLLRKSSIENLVFKNYLFLQNNKKKHHQTSITLFQSHRLHKRDENLYQLFISQIFVVHISQRFHKTSVPHGGSVGYG